MAYASTGQKTPRGLDDGSSTTKSKKRKRGSDNATVPEAQPTPKLTEVPKIIPGERMGDYAARVDQALPVAGLVSKGKTKGVVGERQQSRLEKRMQRMQKEWREQETRRKARLEEQKEEEEDKVGFNEDDEKGRGKSKNKGKRRKKNRGGGGDENEDEDEDPWAVVAANRKREQEDKENDGKGRGLVGLHDVVQAPPKFERVPKAKVGVGDAVKQGGLKKQVEISEARKSVIEEYRRMMRDRREQQVEI
ncbi:MAG: hypothetical protein Q9188_003872 [Gyalolechia gomerana]